MFDPTASSTAITGRVLDGDIALRLRPKAVIGHPRMGRGGSEARVMWLIEALKEDYEITVITTGGWDLAALNAFYGTAVAANEVRVRIAAMPWPLDKLSVAAIRGACYQRFARKIAGEYDLTAKMGVPPGNISSGRESGVAATLCRRTP